MENKHLCEGGKKLHSNCADCCSEYAGRLESQQDRIAGIAIELKSHLYHKCGVGCSCGKECEAVDNQSYNMVKKILAILDEEIEIEK